MLIVHLQKFIVVHKPPNGRNNCLDVSNIEENCNYPCEYYNNYLGWQWMTFVLKNLQPPCKVSIKLYDGEEKRLLSKSKSSPWVFYRGRCNSWGQKSPLSLLSLLNDAIFLHTVWWKWTIVIWKNDFNSKSEGRRSIIQVVYAFDRLY